jgi:predicted dinucleotide-binding enzyme
MLPEAKVVKCFNTINSSQMVDPDFDEEEAEMLICGDDDEAKHEVVRIIREFGWPGALDVGGIDGARWLEALVPLWLRIGRELDTWSHYFKVIRD